jgi:3-dehydroquinate dehydratase-2
MKIKVINGPNLNTLGKREPDKYGTETLDSINERLRQEGLKHGVECEFFQSNSEGEVVTAIQQAANCDGVILNAGAYSHYSIAIRDAVSYISPPVVEVHITNIFAREEFRHTSVFSAVCAGSISGFGPDGYILALLALVLKKAKL